MSFETQGASKIILNPAQDRFRLKIVMTYEGSPFHGWQRQLNTRDTIQEILETALSRISNARINCVASGRTDAGVHARVQVAHADVPSKLKGMLQTGRLQHALNSLLPHTIRILGVSAAPSRFHAQKDVVKKTYLYFIDTTPVQWPSSKSYSWHLRFPLDWEAIEKATALLQGRHDFKAFSDSDGSAKTSVRILYEARWGVVHPGGPFGTSGQWRVLRLTGNGFLKHMVRSIAGTLVKVGEGKISSETVQKALLTQDRNLVGPTAPANGLWLWDILYLT